MFNSLFVITIQIRKVNKKKFVIFPGFVAMTSVSYDNHLLDKFLTEQYP